MITSLIVLGVWTIATPVVAAVTGWHEARLARSTRAGNPDNRSLSAHLSREEA